MLHERDCFIRIGVHRSGQDSGDIDYSIDGNIDSRHWTDSRKQDLLDVIQSLYNAISSKPLTKEEKTKFILRQIKNGIHEKYCGICKNSHCSNNCSKRMTVSEIMPFIWQLENLWLPEIGFKEGDNNEK